MPSPEIFPIVGIGASAGGVEALEGFFRGLPDEPGLAFVVVTHLGSDRRSLLHEIIARYTRLQVHTAANGTAIEANNVYVATAEGILTSSNRHLSVNRFENGRRERKPIDVFFSSLAADVGELAVGIVLSGGDADGTLGVKAIKERGGLTLAQTGDGFGPHHPDMPNSAISTGLIDFAVPVEQMGPKLVEFARSLHLLDDLTIAAGPAETVQALKDLSPEIYSILRNQTGHDFSGYKDNTFMRRVQRRIQVTGLGAPETYVERLRQDPQEVAALFRDLLINVTSFFRDPEPFETLAATVIPALFNGRGADDTVRIWVPGCATGEEVFSLGILLREHMDQLKAVPRVQIFATDIDERSLVAARTARYPALLLDNVSQERKERFFLADGASFVVKKEVRDLCIFSPHSVIRDPPFSRIDLISCRNLLIYFGVNVQSQVVPTFHYALRPDGYLFLGTSESISQFTDLFIPIDKKHRIFQRRADIAPTLRLPLILNALRPGHMEGGSRQPTLHGIALRQVVDAQVMDHFAPAHVVIDSHGDVVYYSARTGKYLEAAPGAPSRQLVAMARKGLRIDLRALLREAVETGRSVIREGISVDGDDGRVQLVNLTVEPLQKQQGGEALYIVLFADSGPLLTHEEALSRASDAENGVARQAEREMREIRERLQSMMEEYETALEELKSTNEELVSVNEELQSTNEELEASKEELVSVNEELHTVNGELSGKVEALDRANSDLKNLFESTNIATVFLDHNLVIRSFTPAMTKLFNILPGDIGRPLTDLSSRFILPGLRADIASVFAGGHVERRVTEGGAHHLVRIAPYNDSNQKVDGVLVTFVDVTSITLSEARQTMLIAELQHRTRNLLAVVQSIAQQTLNKGPAREAFLVRLAALARAQRLLSTATDERIEFAEVVRLELQAHEGVSNGVTIEGPVVLLSVEQVQLLALAIHELTTNAVKHGALRYEPGRLQILWKIEPGANGSDIFALEWREGGLPKPPDSARRGFGRTLIEKALTFTLQAKSELLFTNDGIVCRIEMPLNPAVNNNPTAGEDVHGTTDRT